jgi:hypothetical protein
MLTAVEVIGGLVLLVGLLLAVDWVTAGRTKGRILARAKGQQTDSASVGYDVIENQARGSQFDTWNP